MSRLYAISGLPEAAEYLPHPILGTMLVEVSTALVDLPGGNAKAIMGEPGDLKLRSSMTLFSIVPGSDPVFEAVIKKYFKEEKDKATLQLLYPYFP